MGPRSRTGCSIAPRRLSSERVDHRWWMVGGPARVTRSRGAAMPHWRTGSRSSRATTSTPPGSRRSPWSAPASERRLRTRPADGSSAEPTGGRAAVLRETAMDLVFGTRPEAQGDALRPALDATLRELASYGVTGASEAGDYTADGGIGADAASGTRIRPSTDLGDLVDRRLRLTLGIPVDAIPAAADRSLRTGSWLDGRRTLRFGWAKEYADGALGSGTAALFAPSTCRDGDEGILRVTREELDALFGRARAARIGLAIHAIGDRAVATVLDALAAATPRLRGTPEDRMEHVQLLRDEDAERFARNRMTASVQPIHAASDRDLVEDCWADRQERAYAWRTLRRCRRAARCRLGCPRRVGRSVARPVRGRPPAPADRPTRRLAPRPGAHDRRGARGLHAGAGCRQSRPPTRAICGWGPGRISPCSTSTPTRCGRRASRWRTPDRFSRSSTAGRLRGTDPIARLTAER